MSAIWSVLLIGLGAGVIGGMFGLGGGAIMVPALVLLIGMTQKSATGTSIAAQILPIGLLGAMVYYRGGNLNLKYGLLLALGLLIGNLFGAIFANQPYVSDQLMKRLYGVFLIVLGAHYIWGEKALRLVGK